MDEENLRAIRTAAEYWRSYHPDIPRDYDKKARYSTDRLQHVMLGSIAVGNGLPCMQVKLMTQYLRNTDFTEFSAVPDPYFGGAKGFELVRRQTNTPSHARSLTLMVLRSKGQRLEHESGNS